MKYRLLSVLLLLLPALALLVVTPVSAVWSAEESVDDTLTRGSRFVATITGLPNTSYYIWLPRTFTMSGEQYDQPPVIADGQAGVAKDPPGGPYTIGSYQYNNGNGRTILDDVAPASGAMSNTNYYALVTTNTAGTAVVEFQTSVYTGLRSYSVKVENKESVDRDSVRFAITVFPRRAATMAIITPAKTPEQRVVTRIVTVYVTATPPPETPATIPPAPPATTRAPPATTKAAAGFLLPAFAAPAALLLWRAKKTG
jgi:hypothetical protein